SIHRSNLALFLEQRATLGASFVPPGIVNGMREARGGIRQAKTVLRGWGIPVEDHPDDEDPASAEGASALRPAALIPYSRNPAFVGRAAEMARLADLLARPHAVVAICGLGGVGKTQLATEFAHQCAEDRAGWPGGVFWVPMSDPSGVGTAV